MSHLERLKRFFVSLDWHMNQIPEQPVLQVGYSGQNGSWDVVASVDESLGLIHLFSRAPLQATPDRFEAFSAFFTAVNFGMMHGAWVMDVQDGEVRFRVGFDAADTELTDLMLRNNVLYTVTTMDRYLPALQAIASGKSASEALALFFCDDAPHDG